MGSKLTKEHVTKVLVREFGFNPHHAVEAYTRLERHPVLFDAFLSWFDARTALPNLICEGFTLLQLVEDYGMDPIGAFLTLAWLLEDPEEAKAALAHGFDYLTGLSR